MQEIVAYLNEEADLGGLDEVEMEEAEGTVLAARGPLLATPVAVTAGALAGGFALGRAIG